MNVNGLSRKTSLYITECLMVGFGILASSVLLKFKTNVNLQDPCRGFKRKVKLSFPLETLRNFRLESLGCQSKNFCIQ